MYRLAVDMIVDNLGVAKSLKVGFCISLLVCICIFFTNSSKMIFFHILVTLPLRNCLGMRPDKKGLSKMAVLAESAG
jgi:hypothetical protein